MSAIIIRALEAERRRAGEAVLAKVLDSVRPIFTAEVVGSGQMMQSARLAIRESFDRRRLVRLRDNIDQALAEYDLVEAEYAKAVQAALKPEDVISDA